MARVRRGRAAVVAALEEVHADIRSLRMPGLVGDPVHGPPVPSRILLVGQAPGPHEARLGRPFAWTAGKTLFAWMDRALGASEEEFRARVYIAAVVRAFPGKSSGGGDRVPSPDEIAASRGFLEREVAILRPRLVVPVGRLAIEQVLGKVEGLDRVVGRRIRARYHGEELDVVALPHPSGASTWFKVEPGRSLLARALRELARHPEVQRTFARRRRPARGAAQPRARVATSRISRTAAR